MEPTALLAAINAQHGTTFALADRYLDGESRTGAFAVRDAAGRRGVLKWDSPPTPGDLDRLREIGAVTASLRARAYPAPFYLAIGCTPTLCYSIQELLPGEPLRTVSPALVPRLVALNALQRGQALPGPRAWPGRVVDTVLYGGEGYCLLEPLRTYSAETAQLLATLQAVVARHRNERYETADLVHFDFNPTNILLDKGTISGVIDWHDPCADDCTFDLVTLLFYAWRTPPVREVLWQHTRERVGPGVLGVYLAHLIVRQVDWSIRHHGPQITASWLRLARAILARCRNADDP